MPDVSPTSSAAAPHTRGAHHVGLTVPDLEGARDFFIEQLGWTVVGEVPDYPAVFVSDGAITVTLWRAEEPARAAPFDRKRAIGLHHLALAVESLDALGALHRRLARAPGVTIEFAPQPMGAGPLRHLMCTIPSGIRVEFVASA